MIRPRGCFPDNKKGWEEYEAQFKDEDSDDGEDFGDDELVNWNNNKKER